MKFLADENIPLKAVKALKERGLDIISTLNFAKGLKDEEVLDLAHRQGRILVTFDKDFGELVFRAKRKSKGVILLRFIPKSPGDVINKLEALFNTCIEIEGYFTVVTEDKIRIIPLS